MIGMHCDTLNAVNKHEEKSSTASDKRLLDADAGGVMLLLCIRWYRSTKFLYAFMCQTRIFFTTIVSGNPYDKTLMMRRYHHGCHHPPPPPSSSLLSPLLPMIIHFSNRQNFAWNVLKTPIVHGNFFILKIGKTQRDSERWIKGMHTTSNYVVIHTATIIHMTCGSVLLVSSKIIFLCLPQLKLVWV